jgi:hypothetical protein
MYQALEKAYRRIERALKQKPMSLREMIVEEVQSRELLISYIKEAKRSGRAKMEYSSEGEPVYSI